MTITKNKIQSPFHAGEQVIQSKTGKRDAMEKFGRKAIRSFMPDQHREFYQQLPFIVAGSVDNQGAPWATLLTGKPGFTQSPTSTSLLVDTILAQGDPIADSLSTIGRSIGLLGIEIPTRRRNRVNVRVSSVGQAVGLEVDQSFGNCPQYIQTRDFSFVREPGTASDSQSLVEFDSLDEPATTFIETADTFFVSSFINTEQRPEIEGVDVSHRGGMPGFVKVDGNTLTIPDYPGNFIFNTMGNFLLNPKAGLVFPDFETGDMLMLTGSVEILWDNHPEVLAFKGAERGWRLTVEKGKWLKDALPFRATFKEYSPNSKLSGNWSDATAVLEAQALRDSWQPMKVVKIEQESSVIKSFYFEHAHAKALLPFEAGQHLTIRVQPDETFDKVIRTYTLSSAPNQDYYRISVKKEDNGLVSKFLHEHLKVDDVIKAKAPRGDFYIDAMEKRPAVLLAGGVGITPMISMAKHLANERIRSRASRTLTVFHATQDTEQRAFSKEFRALEEETSGAIKYHSFVSNALDGEKPGVDYNGTGYLSADVFKQVLALDDYEFYLCGPPPFMQGVYDSLHSLGIRDARIFTEAFGPASLTRIPDESSALEEVTEEAEDAVIKFSKSNFEQRWNKGDDTLLEVAEGHGLTPEFGCRGGSCGSCAVKVKSGEVAYRTKPSAPITQGEVLICCAVPAKDTDILEIEL
jgi:ferredoxin-NADP reductase/predicted pyridoxine 5'-phosphate oxidase superfamily flavin-nucleotide-binding protein